MEGTRDEMRKAALSRRNALPSASCCSWSRSIQAHAISLPQYGASQCVAVYCAMGKEVETRVLRDHAMRHGKRVFYPKSTAADAPGFVELGLESGRVIRSSGVAEASGEDPWIHDFCASLIVFVPGLLFDRAGNRLGRGGGWYDRVLGRLENRGFFVGLAYDCQVVERVPERVWDKKVHCVITESGVIDCSAALHPRR